MRWLLLMLALLLSGAAGADPRHALRFVSINLCTDELLLDLADPAQIAGLSPFARQAARGAPLPAGVPLLSGTAEEILLIRPDLVLSSKFMKRTTRELVRSHGVRLEEFDIVRTLPEAREQIARVSALTGREDRARDRLARLDEALARLAAAGRASPVRMLPYSRRGWSAGRETIVGDILARAGLLHAAAGGPGMGAFLGLEAVVALRPDALLLSREPDRAADQGEALLLHPALAALFPPERRLHLSESLTVCGGPALVEAIEGLAGQISRLRPRP